MFVNKVSGRGRRKAKGERRKLVLISTNFRPPTSHFPLPRNPTHQKIRQFICTHNPLPPLVRGTAAAFLPVFCNYYLKKHGKRLTSFSGRRRKPQKSYPFSRRRFRRRLPRGNARQNNVANNVVNSAVNNAVSNAVNNWIGKSSGNPAEHISQSTNALLNKL